MLLDNLRRSSNIDDRRGAGVAMAGSGGGMLFLALVVYLLGGDPTPLLVDGASRMVQQHSQLSPQEEERQKDFVAAVLGSTEDVWGGIFRSHGKTYETPRLTLFTGAVDSACGYAGAAMGPFYCSLDHKVYLDLSFFRDMERQLNAPGDFARAYVVAHEVGHHVQALDGTADRVHAQMEREGGTGATGASVRMELQADCYAGVWANHVQSQFGAIEAGDIDEAMNAATQIGDDRLQQQGQGYIAPDTFTHGTSEQRTRWFKTGFSSGQMESCNTFGGRL